MVLPLYTPLSLASSEAIVEAALAHGRAQAMLPLAVVVLDMGGHVIVAKREDGCGIMRVDVATAKAWGALGMGIPAKVLGQRLAANPVFLSALVAVSEGRMAPNAGGVLILNPAGQVIGAVGISGDTGDNDELCAQAGLTAAGLAHSPHRLD